MAASHGARPGEAERVQKVLAQLGLASRREAESWIRAGRLTVNGKPAELGMRVIPQDQIKLDGRLIRRQPAARAATARVRLSPLARRAAAAARAAPMAAGAAAAISSIASRLPRRAGRRFISVSPLPLVDGGLELLTADGAAAARLQRAMRGIEMEFSLRVRGELSPEQQAGDPRRDARSAAARSGSCCSSRPAARAAIAGTGSSPQAAAATTSASCSSAAAVTLVRMLRTRVGSLSLPRTLPRSHFRRADR